MVAFDWSLNEKSSQVSSTLLSILTNLNNAVVRIISILSLIFNFSSFLFKSLRIIPKAPTIVCITIIFMFYSLFSFLARPSICLLFAFFIFQSVVC